MEIQQFGLEDDDTIPNSKFPLLLYCSTFEKYGEDGAAWLEDRFQQNNWGNAWRNENGSENYPLADLEHAIFIPTQHTIKFCSLFATPKFELSLILAKYNNIKYLIINYSLFMNNPGYPGGSSNNLKTGKESERPQADRNIAALAVPERDPLMG